ncbi:Transcription elongation factor 1 like protein [Plasmodiophora brassicae]|uniref:Transcription elongation factor 1 homolog n=1 Tax=Plasmodiophora brassicae TaxID=37360 RepID=A0A0G4J6E9_PLABS|nr:hypothetical protein PBRA_002913 [Plasmodiophora brassicae]SPQ95401.1 unnamed protein product [Plasmodiophora brassicae]
MGKRKSKKRVVRKVVDKLATAFDCPFCNHSLTVECKMKRSENVAEISCRICDANYRMPINSLTEPVDVYCEWIDECEQANAEEDDDD